MKTFKLFSYLFLIISTFAMISYGQKTIAEGAFSKVETPFVFVARDDKSYAQLQTLVEGLPSASTIDFKKNAVVAGFAGEKSKGGWTVEIKKTIDGRIGVVIQPPGKDMMTAQVITQPYKIALIEVEAEKGISLNLAPDIINKMNVFSVNQGDFEFVGGIAGIRKKFKAGGTVRMIIYGGFATLWFDLKGKGGESKRILSEAGSGTFKNGKIEITRMDAGNFADFPRPPFKINGTLKNKILALKFASLEPTFTDGYDGKGSLTAVKQ